MRQELLDWIEEVEGGYVNDPVDRGGETNMGITSRTLQRAFDMGLVSYHNVNNLTYEGAATIYTEMYYKPAHCDKLPQPLDWVHFDTAVNSGPGKAGTLLQYSINDLSAIEKITVDGAIGPNTIRVLNDIILISGIDAMINTYLMYRMIFYNQIVRGSSEQIKFLSGWLNRVTKLKKAVM